MSECDSFCFCWGKLVEAGRQCGEIYMLSEVETAENVQKVCCAFAVRGVDMNVKVTLE